MNYRTDKYGNRISALGYGCMRFKQTMGHIDMAKAEEHILAAYNAGVNYYDTAYIYFGSEAALGEILKKHGLREKVYIATKLPHYLIRKREDLDRLFAEQLRRLKTDYVDYYLMHMLSDVNTWEKLVELGVKDWIEEKKKSGEIRQIGFSYHGNSETFMRLLDAYDWEFCQIQYNYMDEHSQAGRRGLLYAHEKGVPVVIMEPLRGGKLVRMLPKEAEAIFAAHPRRYTPAQWAFRWLFSQKEVTCVLSGMNSLEMIKDNAATASDTAFGDISSEDQAMLSRVADAINAKMKVGCTGCGYCMPCPMGVDIPGTFACYNRRFTEDRMRAQIEYLMCTAMRTKSSAASNCIGCGKCEAHCPQGIPIRNELKNAQRELEGTLYKGARRVIEKLKLF